MEGNLSHIPASRISAWTTIKTPVAAVFAGGFHLRVIRYRTQAKALKTNREVIDFVSKTSYAIGIIGVNWLSDRNDSTGLSFSKEVRVMSVSAADKATPENSFKPYQAYLFYGDYPLARSIYALLNDPRSALPWGFASFLGLGHRAHDDHFAISTGTEISLC